LLFYVQSGTYPKVHRAIAREIPHGTKDFVRYFWHSVVNVQPPLPSLVCHQVQPPVATLNAFEK
jgi:hypothetical protein